MILHALKSFYDRSILSDDGEIAPPGFEYKELQFLIIIDTNGRFVNIEDTREQVENRLVAKKFLLPRSEGRSGTKSYQKTFLLWDHIGYLLGLPDKDPKTGEYNKRAAMQHETWLKSLKELPPDLLADEGVAAMIKFYENNEKSRALQSAVIEDCLKAPQCNMAFSLVFDEPVPCRKAVQVHVKNTLQAATISNEEKQGICLVTGEHGVITRTHARTPINKDTKCLVGIQKNSGYDSYGKEQGYNAPIIAATEFAYVTALNSLLKSKNQRINIGETAIVFWSEEKTSFEGDFATFFQEPPKNNPGKTAEVVKSLYESVKTGTYMDDAGETKFYILGLSPNAARISVRIWHTGTIAEYAARIKQYFEDFTIIKPDYEPEHYSIWRILVNIAVQEKSENIQPNLSGDFLRAILDGTPYPATLLQTAIRRIRSDTARRVTPVRAALIKAYLNRYYHFYSGKIHKEVLFALDRSQPSTGYQLGRLFATLEKIQEEANPGINATIRERFYGAACAAPVTAFVNLMRLKNHHLAKIDNKGRVVRFERLLGEIMGNLDSFPTHLNMHEQGRFAIGYYHQRQDFFRKKENEERTLEADVTTV